MRVNLKPKALVYPQLCLIIATYDENNNPNVMNAAWGGVADDDLIMICLSPEHKTVKNILLNKELTISFGTKKTIAESDYFGLVSGNDGVNKLDKVGFTYHKSELINAPIIDQYPLTLECKFVSYDDESCLLFAKVINVSADENILRENTKLIDTDKLEAISYDSSNHKYLLVKEVVGNAFSDGKKFIK